MKILIFFLLIIIISTISFASAGTTITQDAANATACTGTFHASYPCSQAYDSNWATYAEDDGIAGTSYVYENFTITGSPSWVNLTIKYNPSLQTQCWNHSSLAWNDVYNANTGGITTINATVPTDCYNTGNLAIRSAVLSSGNDYFEGLIIYYYPFSVSTTLNYPDDAVSYYEASRGVSFNMTGYSIGAGNVANLTIKIYNTTSLYNTSFKSCSATTCSINTNVSLTKESYTWHGKACLATGECSNWTDNRTLSVGYYVFNSMTYESSTFETESSEFSLNFTSLATSVSANLTYKGTYYSISSANIVQHGNDWVINKTLDIPTGTGDNGFIFSYLLTFADGISSFSTSNYTQTINSTTFSLCDDTAIVPFLNFNYKNESDVYFGNMNASISSSSFDYWLGSGSVYKTYTYSSAIQNLNHTFCFLPSTKEVEVEIDAYNYLAVGYQQRDYTGSLTLSSTLTNTSLYLLGTSDGIYVTFQVINTADQTIEGVDITVSRDIGGSSTLIGEKITDDAGSATFWLNPNYAHTFVFTKSGYDTYTTTITPTQSTYTITLTGGQTTNITSYYKEITYWIYPQQNPLNNNTLYTFRFNISSTYWDLDSYGFELTNATYTFASDTGTGNVGSASVDFDLTDIGNQSFIIMKYYWVVEGNYTNGSYTWSVFSQGNQSFSIKNFFEDFSNFINDPIFGASEGSRMFTKGLIAFFIIFLITGTLAYVSGIYSPLAICGGITALSWFFALPGIEMIPSIPPTSQQWYFIPGILLLITISLAIWEWRS